MSSTVEIRNITTGEHVEVKRVIGQKQGDKKQPTIVFVAGIHGNEPSGIFALNMLFRHIEQNNLKLQGNVIGISGNHEALKGGERFLKQDLNRMWLPGILSGLNHVDYQNFKIPEYKQLKEVNDEILKFIKDCEGPVILVDMHTTSGLTKPFVFINSTTDNIDFCKQFPIPIVTGIGNYLRGTLITYLNKLGHISMAFEAGQHNDPKVVDFQLAFAWMCLVVTGMLQREDIPAYDDYEKLLTNASASDAFKLFTILNKYEISPDENFKMLPGFMNFQAINKGEALAHNVGGDISSPFSGKIFMPLYQEQGTDGFFIIRDIEHSL